MLTELIRALSEFYSNQLKVQVGYWIHAGLILFYQTGIIGMPRFVFTSMEQPSREPSLRAFLIMLNRKGGASFRS